MKPWSVAVLAAFLLVLTSCIYEARLVDPDTRAAARGSYNTWTRTISVELPDGETFEGKYVPLDPDDLGEKSGSLFHRVDISTYLDATGQENGWNDYRAVLKGSRGSTMEVIFRYNGPMNSGDGEARTGKGKDYRLLM